MKRLNLLEKLEFHDKNAYIEPLFANKHGRVFRGTLKPGQKMKEHKSPNSPFYLVILSGKGIFTGGDKKEHEFGPNTLLVFDYGEEHSIKALDKELVFVGFLHESPGNVSDSMQGAMSEPCCTSGK